MFASVSPFQLQPLRELFSGIDKIRAEEDKEIEQRGND
jgi:hypothetical protein